MAYIDVTGKTESEAVVKALAQIKGVTEEEIEKRTGENARRLYRIQEGQE